MAPADRVLELLNLFGEVEWARLALGTGDENDSSLPVIVWRFVESASSGDEVLAAQLSERMGPNWVLERGGKSGRNWGLWPAVLAREFATGQWRTDTEASATLASADPDLAARLSDEFWDLIGVLEGDSG